MYLTLQEYQNLGGTMNEIAFSEYEFDAERMIDWRTFNRLRRVPTTDLPPELKRLMYKLVNLLKQQADLLALSNDPMNKGDAYQGLTKTTTPTGRIIAEQSNDGVTVKYSVLSASSVYDSIDKKIDKLVQQYLDGVTVLGGRISLMYRGIYPGE